jgi:spore coat protein U-like protein
MRHLRSTPLRSDDATHARSRPRRLARAFALIAMLGGAGLGGAPAQAMQCSVQASGVEFGVYDPFSPAPTDSVGTLTVSCDGPAGIAVAFAIRIGTGGSGVYGPRTMRDGTTWQLGYNLYTSASRTLVWGDGTGASSTITDGFALSGRRVTRSYPVYGRIPARQNVAPGRYVDSLVVTLEY